MTVFADLRRAWPTTLGIHLFQTLLAGTFALPLAATLRYPELSVREPVAAWISAMTLGASLGEHTARHAFLPLLAAALNYPWLSLAWCRALRQPGTFVLHARYALGRYRSAATVAVATLLALAALGATAYGTARGLGRLTWHLFDERGLDLVRLASVLPFAAAALVVVTLQDAAYAALSGGASSAWQALRAALATTCASLVARRGLFVCGQLAVGLAAWLIPRLAFGAGAPAEVAVFACTQLGALVLTCARALWLALVLASQRTQPT